jgi:two-component system response regulator PilR (NtrC family)
MNEAQHILVIDDESSVREMVSIMLSRSGYKTSEVSDGHTAVELLQKGNRFDLVITDLTMENGDGMLVLDEIKKRDPHCPVIMVTAYGTTDTAVEAMKKGAHDYISKPFNVDEFKIIVAQALKHRQLLIENRELKARVTGQKRVSRIIGNSDAIKNIISMCEKIADSQASVFISGESGTGKEVVARAVHDMGSTPNRPFVAINCGALPENIMESELFGHVKGSFTGATSDKKGLIAEADGGTLFLDEIGELPLQLQVKLLRALQEKTIRKVGGAKEIPVNVRIISATNADITQMVEQNNFRTDLFYRLNVIHLELPPLRERSEDIPPLVHALLPQIASDNNSGVTGIEPDAMRCIIDYNYPGNIRELKNILERAVALSTGSLITVNELPKSVTSSNSRQPAAPVNNISPSGIDLDAIISQIEQDYINMALKQTGGVQSAAAKLLGITVRSLRYRINKNNEE